MELTCKEAQRLIQPYIDRSIDDRRLAALIDHIDRCPVCREELETGFVVDYALRYLDHEEDASFDLTAVFESDLQRSRSYLHIRRVWWIIILLLVALTAAGALYLLSIHVLTGASESLRHSIRRLYHYFRSQMG